MRNHNGATLTELLLVLTIMGIVCSLAATPAKRTLDVLHVRAAREALFGSAMRARSVALTRGGASLIIDPQTDVVTVSDAQGVVADQTHIEGYGVDVFVDGATAPVALRYDAYGIGRMTSRTVRLKRGAAEASLTVSSYGRIRR